MRASLGWPNLLLVAASYASTVGCAVGGELEDKLGSIGQQYDKNYTQSGDNVRPYRFTHWTEITRRDVLCDRRELRDIVGINKSGVTISTCLISADECSRFYASGIDRKLQVDHTSIGHNSNYLFHLEGGKSGDWILRGLLKRSDLKPITVEQTSRDILKQVAAVIDSPRESARNLIDSDKVCPGAMHVRKLALFPAFALTGVGTTPEAVVIRCEHDYGFITPDDVRAGRTTPVPGRATRAVTLDRYHDYLPVRDEMTVKLKDGSIYYTVTSTRTVKALTDRRYEDEYTHTVSRVSQINNDGETTTGRRTIELGDVPAEKFYISAFGLPEPEGLGVPDFQADKRFRRRLYAAGAAVAVVALALLVRSRRRA